MVDHIKAQLAALGQKTPPAPRKSAARPPTPSAPQKPREGRPTPPETPGPAATAPIRYQFAGSALYLEQHPGTFRAVVTGPAARQAEVAALLAGLPASVNLTP